MTKTEISFGLFDVEAKPDSTYTSTDNQPFNNVMDLRKEDIQAAKYATMEPDYWLLDGSFQTFPNVPENEYFGFISNIQSDENCNIDVMIEINFTKLHGSLGLSFVFDKAAGDYPTLINVTWYGEGGALLHSGNYEPDGGFYFLKEKIDNYNRIVIRFLKTNKPYRYVKLQKIDFGQLKTFDELNLISAGILEEVDPLSAEISINTLDFSVFSEDAEFSVLNPQGVYSVLQQRQKIEATVIKDGVDIYMGTYYLDEWENESENIIKLQSIDILGMIDKTDFAGGSYSQTEAYSILDDIMASCGASYVIEDSLKNILLTGKIEKCTHRQAIQQVAIAIGAIVDCSRSSKIHIYKMPTDCSNLIEYSRKFEGQKLTLKPYVTGVEVTAHKYTGNEDVKTVYGAYISELPAGQLPNVLKVENATLISDSNAQETANRIYNFYQIRHKNEFDFILKSEKPGIITEVETMYNQKLKGFIQKLDIDLCGGFTAKAEIIGGVSDG